MRLALPLTALVCIACGRVEERAAASEPAEAVPVARSGAPHGGMISVIAVTESGDAALTLDQLGELRLWPALDGSREPVPIQATAARALALAHAGDGWIAGIVDDADVATVLSISRDGTVRQRTQLSADVAVEQVIAIDNGLLVRRDDESIDRYDVRGVRSAHLVAPAGEQIASLAVRSGSAIAALSGQDHKITMLRRVSVDGELRWGDAIKLPEPILPAIALAPGHQRVAAIHASGRSAEVIALADHGGPTVQSTTLIAGELGFIDDEHLAVASSAGVQWWAAGHPQDPWAANGPVPTTPPNPTDQSVEAAVAFAAANHLVLTGYGSALALATGTRTRFLGWAKLPTGIESIAGSTIGYGMVGNHYLWLDDKLGELRRLDTLQSSDGSVQLAVAINDHVVALERYREAYQIALVDADHPTKQVLVGSYPSVQRLEYSQEAHVLVVQTEDRLERFTIDIDHLAAHKLTTVNGVGGVWFVRALDPARAHGDVLTTLVYDSGGVRVEHFREPAKTDHLQRRSEKLTSPTALAIDPTGVVYTLENADGHSVLVGHQDDREVMRFTPPEPPQLLAVSPDGASLAMLSGHTVLVTDARGVERWRYTAWSTSSIAFTGDGRHVLARTAGGLILLDATTGKLATRACGWGFGLHDEAIQPDALGAPPVCED
jgi:hypothetical protein